jgi:hypothetical protein
MKRLTHHRYDNLLSIKRFIAVNFYGNIFPHGCCNSVPITDRRERVLFVLKGTLVTVGSEYNPVRYPIEKFSPNHITLQNCSFDVKKLTVVLKSLFMLLKKGIVIGRTRCYIFHFKFLFFYTDDTQQY